MRVLITGATGFLGGHMVAAFAAHGDEVSAVVRPSSQTESLRKFGVRLHVLTLDQTDRVAGVMNAVDVVVHGVAKVHTHGGWREFHETTVEGTRRMLQASKRAGVPHFIHMSTVGVYGWPRKDGRAYEETDRVGTPYRWNYYTRAKIMAEQLVRESSIAATILRPTWVYGPHDNASIGRIVEALRARRLRIIGDGTNRLSLVYVADVAQAVVAAAHNSKSRGETLNVSADETCCNQRDLLLKICRIADLPEPTRHISYGAAHGLAFLSECIAHATRGHVCPPLTRLAVLLLGGERRYRSDKIRRLLDWKPSIGISDGLHYALGHEPARTVVSR